LYYYARQSQLGYSRYVDSIGVLIGGSEDFRNFFFLGVIRRNGEEGQIEGLFRFGPWQHYYCGIYQESSKGFSPLVEHSLSRTNIYSSQSPSSSSEEYFQITPNISIVVVSGQLACSISPTTRAPPPPNSGPHPHSQPPSPFSPLSPGHIPVLLISTTFSAVAFLFHSCSVPFVGFRLEVSSTV
jgi:hypothetical protein